MGRRKASERAFFSNFSSHYPLSAPCALRRQLGTSQFLRYQNEGKFLRRYRFSHIGLTKENAYSGCKINFKYPKHMTLRLSIDTSLDTNLVPPKMFPECMTSLPSCLPLSVVVLCSFMSNVRKTNTSYSVKEIHVSLF